MDSCFALLGVRLCCVAMIYNASQKANMTGSLYQVPYFELTCAPKQAFETSHFWSRNIFHVVSALQSIVCLQTQKLTCSIQLKTMAMTSMALQSALHMAAAPTVRAAFKTWLSYRNNTIIAFSFEANKYKANS